MNRMTRHVSADGPIAIRTCANGSLTYRKCQDIVAYVEEFTNKQLTKKFVATNVSVRLLGIKRRSEGMAMSSHEETTLWNDQEDGMMKGKRRRQAETQAR